MLNICLTTLWWSDVEYLACFVECEAGGGEVFGITAAALPALPGMLT